LTVLKILKDIRRLSAQIHLLNDHWKGGPVFDCDLRVSINLLCPTDRIFTKVSLSILLVLPLIRLVKYGRELGSMASTRGA